MGGVILQPLAFGLKFIKVQSPEDVSKFLLIILLNSNHLVIYIFLVGRRSSGVMGEGIRRKSLGDRGRSTLDIPSLSSGEKTVATHSSTLAWKIPWAEEPGRLQSMGLRRVRHNFQKSHF